MKKSERNLTNMPKTVVGFYTRYIFKGIWWLLISVWLLRFLIGFDSVLWPTYQRWVVAMLENAPKDVNLIKWCLPTVLMITILNIATSSLVLLRNWGQSYLGPKVTRKISETLTDYVHTQSMAFWVNRMAGQVYSRINDIVHGIGTIIFECWNSVVMLIMACINSAALFTVNKYIAFSFIFIFVFRAYFMWRLRKPIKRSAKDVSDSNAKLTGKLVDSFSNATNVKLFAGVIREHNYMDPIRTENVKLRRRASFWQRVSMIVPSYLWDTMFGVTVMLCVYLFAKQEMEISDIVYSISVYNMVIMQISVIMDSIPNIIENLSAASKAYTELVVPIEVTDKPNASELTVSHGKIEFKNVSFKYKNRYVLRDLSLTIKPGERVGIVGPSGAGKTTLVNLLMRFYDVKGGSILIDGHDIRDVTQGSLRENIAFIPQDPAMFNRTIRENIAYGRPGASDSEIHTAAKSASAHMFILSTEKKYETLVGDRGIKMSGGQRQRIAIARAFLKNAPILILDEATSALDSETEVSIQKSFEKLSKNRTTIAIAHRLSTLRNMDRIVVLEKGRIVESGTHQALLRRKGEYAKLWKMQSGGFLQDSAKK
ncbi:MAG: ABC transporter ATP-binding protein [Alphaproteobacteria bacterium]|nr:ABC transporter ATP-binding protein [Alphaproteobacteria bacterium]